LDPRLTALARPRVVYRPILSSVRAPHIKKPAVCQKGNLVMSSRWEPDSKTDLQRSFNFSFNFSVGKARPEPKAENLTEVCDPSVKKCGILDFSNPYRASTAYYKDDF
jgi:hypothetical protein